MTEFRQRLQVTDENREALRAIFHPATDEYSPEDATSLTWNGVRFVREDIDSDHAAALERERIAAWIVTDAAWPEHDMRTDEWLAQSIRNGDHWKDQP